MSWPPAPSPEWGSLSSWCVPQVHGPLHSSHCRGPPSGHCSKLGHPKSSEGQGSSQESWVQIPALPGRRPPQPQFPWLGSRRLDLATPLVPWALSLLSFCPCPEHLEVPQTSTAGTPGLCSQLGEAPGPQHIGGWEGSSWTPGLKAHTLPQALGFQLERRCTPSPRRPMGWLIPPVPSHPTHISVNSPLLKSPRINHLVCAICFPLGPCPNPAGLVSPPVWSPCYLKLPSGECRGWAQIPGDGLWVLDQGMVQLQGTWTWRVRIRNPDGDGPLCGAFASCRSQQQPHFRGRQQAALSTD